MRKILPGLVSYISLACGLLAMILAVDGELGISGGLILASYILDALDGEIARKLKVISPFGLQLDSLVDTAVFGVAAPFLVIQHLIDSSIPWWLAWISMVMFCTAGIYRLARFNLYAGEDKPCNTIGLTISTSGAFLALSILTDLVFETSPIPDWTFLLIIFFLALLMISRIHFPELKTIFSYRIPSFLLLGALIISAIWLTPQLVWLITTTAYITFGVGRAAYRKLT